MRYLITGGTGFIGSALVKRLYDKENEIRVLARNDSGLATLKYKYPKIKIFAGSVADEQVVRLVMRGVDGVFHLAGFKHTVLAEENVTECARTNILGANNILNESVVDDTAFVLGVSTDKASQIAGVYGSSKWFMERMFQEYQERWKDCRYRIVRFGNVMYSTGSVMCKWKESLQAGRTVTITDPNATRFFWTVEDAVDLMFDCLDNATDAKPYGRKMKAMRMGDVLSAMCQKYGNGQVLTREIGLQAGENLHEKIFETGEDSSQAERYTEEEIFYLV